MLSDVNELRSTVEKNKAEQRARNLEKELDAAANNANPTEYEALLIDLLGMLAAVGGRATRGCGCACRRCKQRVW